MDDAAIELEKEALLAEKQEINTKLESLPLTSIEKEELARKQKDDDYRTECQERCVLGVIGWMSTCIKLAVIIWIGAIIHACVTNCSVLALITDKAETTNIPICASTPFTIGLIILVLGLSPLLLALGA